MAHVRLVITFWVSICSIVSIAQSIPVAKRGIIDVRNFNFADNKSVKLNGEWVLYKNKLVDPASKTTPADFVSFPHQWGKDEVQNFATYRLTILVDKDIAELSLNMPQLYCSYSLWVNDRLIAKNGTVTTERKNAVAQWLPQIVTFKAGVDTINIHLQISNFHHSIGGLKVPIFLGLPEKLLARQSSALMINASLFIVLTFIGFLFLMFYFFKRKEKSVLYFSLVCLTWALRSIFSEQYLAIHWMPWFDWELGVKIEYATLYLEMAWAVLFISNLYPLDAFKIANKVLLYPNFAFLFLTMATPAIIYTRLLNVYLVFSTALLIYIVIVILRAVAYERYGAWFSVLGVLSLTATFAYNILSYEGLFDFHPITFYASYLVFFLFLAVALMFQLSPKASSRDYSETLSLDDFKLK